MSGLPDTSFSNKFGEVLPDRIVFYLRKSFFGGSVREEYAVKHITSIRHESKKWPIWGIVSGLFGLISLNSSPLLGLVFLGIAAILFIGVPSVTINSAGGERHTSYGSFSDGEEAKAYARAVREVVFGTA